MVDVFRLKPIKTDHPSWGSSCIERNIEWVKLWAYSEDDARYKVARATDVPDCQLPRKPSQGKYAKILFWESPWELPELTSCDLDTSDPKPGIDILLSDGRKLPFK
jgi:hypothetical protein